MYKVQFASDLHLEFLLPNFSSFDEILVPSAPILVLAGDICTTRTNNIDIFRRFFQWISLRWTTIIYVPGNHDFIGFFYKDAERRLIQLCEEFNNILYANNRVIVNDFFKVTFLCSTLWSYIPNENRNLVGERLIEYKQIEDFRVSNVNEMYYNSRQWLNENIKRYRYDTENTLIVVTHHAPIKDITSNPKYRNDPLNCAFSSNCYDIMEGVNYWIFGHTHYNCNIRIDNITGTRVLSNQMGYSFEDNGYKKDGYIQL